MKIVVNAGHGKLNSGGYDPGAIGTTGLQEATETREVAERVVRKFKERGIDAPFIQDGDLRDVSNFSNAQKADCFVSIHCNSANFPSAHGIETFCYKFGGTGEKIARSVQTELIEATGLTDRGVKEGNFHVIRETDASAILTEIGFISNPTEEALMMKDEWDDKVAEAIVVGICNALGLSNQEGGNDVLDHAVIYFTDRDFSSARMVSDLLGGCAMFCRNGQPAIHPDAMNAKHLVVIGGPEAAHPNVTNCCGTGAPETAILAAQYAQTLQKGGQ